MEAYILLYIALGVIIVLALKGVRIVPQQEAWVLETLGKYDRTLHAGLNFIVPFVQRVSYKHSLKEQAVAISEQTAITQDNVSLVISGIIYLKIVDAKDASYGVDDPKFALQQLAQTSMRSEIGKISLDKTFEERERLNHNIVTAINEAAHSWGIQCMRYEIKDIDPPESVLEAMELQVAAERQKRADILRSEGESKSRINIAEAEKQEVVLESEGAMTDRINRARGEAEAIRRLAAATAEGINEVGASISQNGGREAASLRVAQDYVDAFGKLAKESTTVLLPHQGNDIASAVTQAMAAFNTISGAGGNNVTVSGALGGGGSGGRYEGGSVPRSSTDDFNDPM